MEKIKQLAISESGFIFDPTTGNSFTANETALFLLKKMTEGVSQEDLSTQMTSEFEISEDEASHDVINFFNELQRLHLA